MAAAQVSQWARRYVVVASLFFVVWHVGALVGVSRAVEVYVGLFGFVFHVIFAKAYALIPSYFNRELGWSHAPMVQFPLSSLGVVGLVVGSLSVGSGWIGSLGAALWVGGVFVFVATIGYSIADNLLGRETGTSAANSDREAVDRFANMFMPVAIVYLLGSSIDLVAFAVGGVSVYSGYQPRVTHLFAVGTATLFMYAIGFRLLPRFFVAYPPKWLVRSVLVAGALGPILLVHGFLSGTVFQVGSVLVGFSILGYAGTISWLFWQSDRSRIGLWGVLVGAGFGVLGVGFGLWFAFVDIVPVLVASHYRVMLLGFLSMTVMGVSFQFYPPNVGEAWFVSNRAGGFALGSVAVGVAFHVIGIMAGLAQVVQIGFVISLIGAVVYAYILIRLFIERYERL